MNKMIHWEFYGGIKKMWQQWQDDFLEARSGSKWTAQGISKGLWGVTDV
jgi:hypothetical protein